jgi:hypothetical protein
VIGRCSNDVAQNLGTVRCRLWSSHWDDSPPRRAHRLDGDWIFCSLGNQPVYASASAMHSGPLLIDSTRDSGAIPVPQTAVATCRASSPETVRLSLLMRGKARCYENAAPLQAGG